MKRVFISLKFPENIIEEIKKIQEKIEKENLFFGKFTEPKNLHLTLKFLGEIGDEKIEEVKERLRTFSLSPPARPKDSFAKSLYSQPRSVINKSNYSFAKSLAHPPEIELNSIGIFSENFIRILWIHLSNCEKLQKGVDESLTGLFEPEKRFMSHVTIARIKKVKDKKKLIEFLKEIKTKNLKFNADKFYLMKSRLSHDGPEYEVIEKFILRR